jgi:hypothetical protein
VHKKHKRITASVLCSVVLPHALLEKAKRLAPPSLRSNVNRLVVVSLEGSSLGVVASVSKT